MERLWHPIEQYLAGERVELDDLELSGRTLRVVVDAEGGVDLDHIADLARGISRVLDDEDDFLPDSYNLEVSSPGLERKLRRPRHYVKSIGRQVSVKTTSGDTYRGVITGADEDHFTVEVDGEGHSMDYGSVTKARTIFSMEKR
jgi:ribosome maturation factor RimP